jgi:hypothetical protein
MKSPPNTTRNNKSQRESRKSHCPLRADQITCHRYEDGDPAAQTLAASVAFRGWALPNPKEFGLIFANAAIAKTNQRTDTPDSPAPTNPAFRGGTAVLGVL